VEETVTFMDEDPFLGWGLRPVEMADRAVLNPYFASLSDPLSDYTFAQLFTWRNSLRIIWRLMDGHLCVFANGTGDLTLLMPPIGDTGGNRAMKSAFELMDAYNAEHGVPDRSRVEYASDELVHRFDCSRLEQHPMRADYLYDVNRMIDLAGGDLSSKRQAKNRFLRNYEHRVETYSATAHFDDCMRLLDTWKIHQDAHHLEEPNNNAIKRSKESIATALCLQSADVLGLEGMVVYVREGAEGSGFGVQGSGVDGPRRDTGISPVQGALEVRNPGSIEAPNRQHGRDARVTTSGPASVGSASADAEPHNGATGASAKADPTRDTREARHTRAATQSSPWVLRAFTFGEPLGSAQSSITIEKTDLNIKGLAQFIFSEFCRTHWSRYPLVNVGDDWGLETLAWTKQSYRPVKMLQKYVLRRQPAIVSPTGIHLAPVPTTIEFPPGPAPVEESAMTRSTTVRAATRADIAATVEIEQATFSAHAISKRQMHYLQQRDSAIFLVAEQGGQVVGDGIALVRQHKAGLTGRIYSLVVRPDCRGQRVGEKLLKSLLAELDARSARRVYLEVEQSNQSAIRLYDRLGFHSIGKLPDYYGKGNHGLHMMYESPTPRPAHVRV
jgi:ribosomal-protein-alanine acetyltransferase